MNITGLNARYENGCLIVAKRKMGNSDGFYITHNSGSGEWDLYEIKDDITKHVASYPNVGEAIANAGWQ